MRDRWSRANPLIALDLSQITVLLRPAFAGASAVASEPVGGGLANTNIKVAVSNRAEPVMLRLYQRGAQDAAKEAALLRKLTGRVPVPCLRLFSADNPLTGHPYAILDWIEGERLDVLVGIGNDVDALGGAVGHTLARIHAVRFEMFGFLGPQLEIPNAIDLDRAGLIAYIHTALIDGRGGPRLGAALVAQLVRLARDSGRLISQWPGPCLVHGDFNGSNVLMRRCTPQEPVDGGSIARPVRWEIAAVLDWEFALSATPAFDFAQLLRQPLADRPDLAAAAARSYRAAGQSIPDNWRQIALITDLFAWIDVVSRAELDPVVIDDARAAIRRTLAELHDGGSGR
jgi:aminoglycoside phosphotransferase (APT) family kinase protein